MYRKVIMLFGIVGVSLSLVLGLISVITWQIVAVLIAVSLGIPSLILTHEKLKPEVSVKPIEERREQEQEIVIEERNILREETIHVSPAADGYYYELELKRGENLKGEIISDSPIDIYLVDSTNFKKWDKDRTFYHEYCNESVLKTKIDYVVPKKGTWYLIIENNGRKSAKTKVYLYI
ncbi:MAG: DUF1883 domain-containing protein [Candidatus Bathyarchaeota archaeon]|nr:DUF1883 domain-containing protein [Candidatus Bathyarchaeota archaeon]